MEVNVKSGFKLPNKKVVVKFNPHNQKGMVRNPKHVAYQKMEGCYDGFVVGMNRNGSLKNPLTNEEKEALTEILGLPDDELSIYNKKGRFWTMSSIGLNKTPKTLDLSDPEDYLTYKILLTNTDKICPNITELKNKATYDYYIEDADDVAKVTASENDIDEKAWSTFGEIKNDFNKLKTILKVYNQSTNKPNKNYNDTKIEVLRTEISNIIRSNKKLFVEIVSHSEFDTIGLIANAIDKKIVTKQGLKYYSSDNELIANNIKEMIDYLNAGANYEFRLMLEKQTAD